MEKVNRTWPKVTLQIRNSQASSFLNVKISFVVEYDKSNPHFPLPWMSLDHFSEITRNLLLNFQKKFPQEMFRLTTLFIYDTRMLFGAG